MKKRRIEIRDYDRMDTTAFINESKPLKLRDLGLALPAEPPTKVVSIRLPTGLLNELKARSTDIDMPYQALIKLLLDEGMKAHRSSGR
jgi:predicted DNA binding CopG/RHH family protein